MSMTTSIIGFIASDDETYINHCNVLRACIDARISRLPKETAEYFNEDFPGEHLFEGKLEVEIPYYPWTDNDSSSGYQIKVSDIPEGVDIIRFENSY